MHDGIHGERMKKLALVACCLFSVLGATQAVADTTVHGAILPGGSHEVGRDRYQSPSPYAETLKYYQKIYSADHYPRKLIADVPGVRGIHLSNPGHGGWDGLNIYELNGVTRIYVLSREPKPSSHKS